MKQVFDRNSDGYISKSELYQTMKELGVRLSMDDLNEMMSAADMNQDGRIDYAGNADNTASAGVAHCSWGDTASVSPLPTGIGDPALCGSQLLVTPISLCRFRD